MKRFTFLLAALSLLPIVPPAEAGLSQDIGRDLASPVTTPAKTVFWIGTAATLALVAAQDLIDTPLQKWATREQLLGSHNKWGDYAGRNIPNGAYALGMIAAGALGEPDGYRRAEVMALGTLYAVSWSTLLKFTVREPRPNDGSDRKSFPSGHTTSAFAFAGVVGAEHGLLWGGLAYAMATAVGYSRMAENKHYFRDVVAGATIGASYGIGISWLRRQSGGAQALTLAPIAAEGQYGLLARMEF